MAKLKNIEHTVAGETAEICLTNTTISPSLLHESSFRIREETEMEMSLSESQWSEFSTYFHELFLHYPFKTTALSLGTSMSQWPKVYDKRVPGFRVLNLFFRLLLEAANVFKDASEVKYLQITEENQTNKWTT